MSLAQGNNTPTRPRIEPGSPDPESDALTTRPVRSPSVYLMLFYAPDNSTWFVSLRHYFLHTCIYLYVLYRSKKGVSVYWINDP